MERQTISSVDDLGILDDPKLLHALGKKLMGCPSPSISFKGDIETLASLEAYCTYHFLAQYNTSDSKLYTLSLRLAEKSPYPATQITALIKLQTNMADWHIKKGQRSIALFGDEINPQDQKRHISFISDALFCLSLAHPDKGVRYEAARALFVLTNVIYYPKNNVKDPNSFGFLDRLLLSLKYEDNPTVADDKLKNMNYLLTTDHFLSQVGIPGERLPFYEKLSKDCAASIIYPRTTLERLKEDLQIKQLIQTELKRRATKLEAELIRMESAQKKPEELIPIQKKLEDENRSLRLNKAMLTALQRIYIRRTQLTAEDQKT